MTTAEKIIHFYKSLESTWKLPKDIELLFPFDRKDTMHCVERFYQKYFSDNHPRRMIMGINPGRFGAGITGVPFSDPKILLEKCGIDNPFKKQHELSAIFVYEFIDLYGGMEVFYQDFFISSVCPLGFIRDGININYYDDKALYQAVEKHIINAIHKQIKDIGIITDVAFSLGKGTNYKFLKKLNDAHGFFEQVKPLPHPRWVMQYRRKRKDEFAHQIVEDLKNSILEF